MAEPLVSIVMGSRSDWDTMKAAAEVLAALDIAHEVKVVSAHRTPALLQEFATEAEGRGIEVIIAGAGGAAHLPGMVAANTVLPVLGVPVQSKALNGLDSLLSIVQMPGGVPVGTMAIGTAGCAERRAARGGDRVARSPRDARAAARVARGPHRRGARASRPPRMRVGVLGGGQLGLMLSQAAAALDIDIVLVDPATDLPPLDAR